MLGTGLDGSFTPCAQAWPLHTETQETRIQSSFDARIVTPLNGLNGIVGKEFQKAGLGRGKLPESSF
jgi:hypothetical protein